MKTLEERFPTLTKEEISKCIGTAKFIVGMSYDGRIPEGAEASEIVSQCQAATEKKEEG